MAATSKPAAAYSYLYGAVGNRTNASGSVGGPALSSTYGSDNVFRLTQESLTSPGQQAENGALIYGLDAVGNRKSLASTLTGINGQSASYDNNDRVVGNSYDANGNTLGAGGVTTMYLVDEANPTGLPQVVEDLTGGAVKTRYLYGLERISQTQVATAVTSFYGYDGHGDVRYLMDVTGKVTDTYDYDAFGNVVGTTGSTANAYRYQGEALDAETGLYYLRARYYDPVAGRFLSVDPMVDRGQHPYEYAGADPVNGHDPTGTQDIIEYTLLLDLLDPQGAVHLGSCLDLLKQPGNQGKTPAEKMQLVKECLAGGGPGGPGKRDPKKKGSCDTPATVADGPVFDPGRWNKDPTSNNCYTYARDILHGSPDPAAFNPGGGNIPANSPCGVVEFEAIRDGLRTPCKKGGCPYGFHVVKLFLGDRIKTKSNPKGEWDFHWYRQDADGKWSSKHGYEKQSTVGPQVDPDVDARRTGYTTPCKDMCAENQKQ
jgi:RHS repeat-associated protein